MLSNIGALPSIAGLSFIVLLLLLIEEETSHMLNRKIEQSRAKGWLIGRSASVRGTFARCDLLHRYATYPDRARHLLFQAQVVGCAEPGQGTAACAPRAELDFV